jgi:hypothetical protein
MHPAMARLYHGHNFEFQFNQHLGAPTNQPLQPQSAASAPQHLNTVIDTFRHDHEYHKNIRNDAQAFARRNSNMITILQTLIPPTRPRSPADSSKPTSTQPGLFPLNRPRTQVASTKPGKRLRQGTPSKERDNVG